MHQSNVIHTQKTRTSQHYAGVKSDANKFKKKKRKRKSNNLCKRMKKKVPYYGIGYIYRRHNIYSYIID